MAKMYRDVAETGISNGDGTVTTTPKKRRLWICPKCNTVTTRIQRVQYGHVENGEFVMDEESKFQCVYCHSVYEQADFKA